MASRDTGSSTPRAARERIRTPHHLNVSMMVSLDALRWQNRLLGDELGLGVAQLAVHIRK
jgi:hypothetical protein